jgi:biopolymer transport protein ExbD
MAATRMHGMNSEINVTPFLDVLLVLIIIFLSSMMARKTMDAQLPVPCTAECAGDESAIVLEVLNGGAFLLNKQPVIGAQLESTLRSVYASRPDKVIQVAGHRDARYQDILSAMDVARSAGVRVISIPPSDSYSSK